MSGLVNGLQNRLRRFESATHLIKEEDVSDLAYPLLYFIFQAGCLPVLP